MPILNNRTCFGFLDFAAAMRTHPTRYRGLRIESGLQFIGMDLVEVFPAYDVSEITALAGATIAWEYLCMLGPRR
jgi:arginase family enzyme